MNHLTMNHLAINNEQRTMNTELYYKNMQNEPNTNPILSTGLSIDQFEQKMQNEPNFKNPQINVISFKKKSYSHFNRFQPQKNEPNFCKTNPICSKTKNEQIAQFNNEQRTMPALSSAEGNYKQFSNEPNFKNTKINVTTVPRKDYMKKMPSHHQKTNPIRSQIHLLHRKINSVILKITMTNKNSNFKISRRQFIKAASLGPVTLAIPGCSNFLQTSNKNAKKPNIVFILIDDMGYKDLGCYGSKYYETPNIDKLASQGMSFTDAYTCGPNCAPTRASLMSGQYTPRHGVITVHISEREPAHLRKLVPIPNKKTLDPKIVTIAEAVKPAGYTSACIGKWHLGNSPQFGPEDQGFDVNVGGYQAGAQKTHFSPYHNRKLKDGPKGEYLTDRLTNEALKFIDENKNNPFFLYLPHYAVHTPIQAKKKNIEKYEAKQGSNGQSNPVYAAMIESLDEGIGKILSRLDKLGLTENTLLIVSSDNGGVGGYQQLGIKARPITSNAPLRGGKGMLYEGGIRVPLIVRWPGKVKPGTRCKTPVTSVDFYPTLLETAGAPRPSGQILDGQSIVPLLKQTKDLNRDAIFWHFPAYLEAKGGTWRTTPVGVIRSGDWNLLEFFEDGNLELYNLRNDISEKHNLAGQKPQIAAELHKLLKNWRKSVCARVPTEPNPKYNPNSKGT